MFIGTAYIQCGEVVLKTNISVKNGIIVGHVDFSTHQAIQSLDAT